MENLDIEFGDNITVISGLNGTGKSTILGLIGHFFKYDKKDSNNKPIKAFDNQKYQTKFSEVFRFCPKHDFHKEYIYNAYFINEDGLIIEKIAKSGYVSEKRPIRIFVGEKKKDLGKIFCPVIYLSLKRLFPLAQEKQEIINVFHSDLDGEMESFYIKNYNMIFTQLQKGNLIEQIKTKNKNVHNIKTSEYGAIGNSAGQDNLGQIILAVLSLKKVNGGILLIDEVDTTLFPGAQINLINFLIEVSYKFKIQVVFTTHSLEIINYIINHKTINKEQKMKINFLEIPNKKVINTKNLTFDHIKKKILMERKVKIKIDPIYILCEDNTARLWCNNLKKVKGVKVDIAKDLGSGGITSIAKQNLPAFKNIIFLLDGDQKSKFTEKSLNKINNLLFLPGNKCPETFFFKYCLNCDPDDELWKKTSGKINCFNNYADVDPSDHKDWFKDNKIEFGNYNILFSHWKRNNPIEVDEFNEKLTKIIEKIKRSNQL